MKKILVVAMLLMLIAPSLALPDVYDQLRGRQMVADRGAPWYADSAVNYFGTGKDVSMMYNQAKDRFYINDTDLYVAEDTTIAGNLAVSGSTISNGKTTDPFYVNDLFYVSDTSALNYTTVTDLRASDDGYFTDDVGIGGTAALNETTATTVVVSGHSHLNQTYTAGHVDSGTSELNATEVTTLVASGASYLNGTTIGTSDTLAVTTADKLTVGSVIVPQEMVITAQIGASEVDQTVFIADDAWQITKIEEVHTVAQNTAYPNTGSLSVMKCTGTQAPGSGSALHNTTMYLNSTVETVVTPTLNAATGALNLADGNRIALNFNGTMTTFAGGCVTIHMKRI